MPQILKAGDLASVAGLYRVTHYQHRLPHLVSVVAGTVLPHCQRCGDHVRFELTGNANEDLALLKDTDFSEGSS